MSFYEITKLDRFIWTKYSQDDIFVIACEGTLGRVRLLHLVSGHF